MAESLAPLSAAEWASMATDASRFDELVRPDLLGRTQLHNLASNAPRDVAVRILAALPSGTLSCCTTKSGDTPLHWLVDDARSLIAGDAEVVTAMLAAGADPHAHDSRGCSALASLRRRVDAGSRDSAIAAACIAAIEAHAAVLHSAASGGPSAAASAAGAGVPLASAATFSAASAAPAAKGPKKMISVKLKK